MRDDRPVVAVCMPEAGHMNRLLPIVSALVARGRAVHVMTDARFREDVERCGGRFYDLFGKFPLEGADATSMPVPCRYVTFAGVYAEPVTDEIRALDPDRIVYESFAVIAPVAARRLRVPCVSALGGHAMVPARTLKWLSRDPRVAVSERCHEAVRTLREDHGWESASPFSYSDSLSPYLNLYGEPPEFLRESDRRALEPLAFFGCLAPDARPRVARRSRRPIAPRRIYVSFGTVIWRYYADIALAALRVLVDVFGRRDVEVTISLGRHALAEEDRRSLERPNVRVEDYVDQWSVLAASDAFVTHHGLNSTHEAIYHEVPLISYPFFADQPVLAGRCHELGLGVPLVDEPRSPIDPAAVERALDALAADRDRFASRLAEARRWELAVIESRPAVIDRLLSLSV